FKTVFCHTKKPPKVRFLGLTFGGRLKIKGLFSLSTKKKGRIYSSNDSSNIHNHISVKAISVLKSLSSSVYRL
ncbi:hypothetical protein QP636_14045, partial [Enterococcus faecalis]|uniref:hypothetical protein n=1 Tax=Enterococcus faecalis TaxID=1351 RepID=UPI00255186BF